MSGSDNLQKRTLEFLRLAADCTQLSRGADSSDLQAHFLRMAERWHALADQVLSGIPQQEFTERIQVAKASDPETSVADLPLNSNSFAKA